MDPTSSSPNGERFFAADVLDVRDRAFGDVQETAAAHMLGGPNDIRVVVLAHNPALAHVVPAALVDASQLATDVRIETV